MSEGAFRDASAALERATALGEENELLREELATLRAQLDTGAGGDIDELRALRRERDQLRAEIESVRASSVAAVQRGRDEVRELLRGLIERIADKLTAEGRRQTTPRILRALEERNEAQKIVQLVGALIVDRDELASDLARAHAGLALAAGPKGVMKHVLRWFR